MSVRSDIRDLRSRFSSLRPRQRFHVAVVALFLFWHTLATLVGGLRPNLREHVWPAFSWYGDKLRLVNTWGMFSRPHAAQSIFSYGVTGDGKRHRLYPAEYGSLRQRLMDQRLRKLQSHLAKEHNRKKWGSTFVQQLCRSRQVNGQPLEAVELELILPGSEDRLRKTTKIIHHEKCRPE